MEMLNYKQTRTPKYIYQRYKINLSMQKIKIPDKNAKPLPGGKYPPIDAFAIYKTKVIWNNTSIDGMILQQITMINI